MAALSGAPARLGGVAKALLAIAIVLAASTCSERPEPPARTNPFDPENPGGSTDPVQVRAVLSGTGVEISWNAVPIADRSGYRVYRRTPSDADFVSLLTTGPNETSALDDAPERDAVSYYLVTVVAADGTEADRDQLVADSVDVPSLLRINDPSGPDTTSVRSVHVYFFSERAESVYLADSLDAKNPVGLRDPVAFAPDTLGYPWTLPEGGTPGGRKTVYGTIRRVDGTLSPTASDNITVTEIDLVVLVDGAGGGTISTGRRAVSVAIAHAAGAESLEVTLAETFADQWIPFVAALEESLPAPGSWTLSVRAKNDFGIADTATASGVADTLGGASIALNAGAAQTSLPTVSVVALGGVALRICAANTPAGLASCDTAGFEPFDGAREDWPLDPASRGGFAFVYARLANDWDTTDVLVDSIFFLDSLGAR